MVANGSPDIIILADKISVDDTVPVSGQEPAVARDACKAGHVVHRSAVWCLHDELVRRNLTPTCVTSAAQAEQTAKYKHKHSVYHHHKPWDGKMSISFRAEHRRRSSVNFGGKTFLPDNICMKN